MIKDLQKDFDKLVGKRRRIEVFNDFCKIFAITLRNQVDKKGWQDREDDYLRLIKDYDTDIIVEIIGKIVIEMDKHPRDILGEMYMSNDSAIKGLGQFFTPSDISDVLARITYNSERTEEAIKDKGFVTLDEPSIGGGVFILSFIERMKMDGYNPQSQLYVSGTDIDRTAVYMSYIHLSLTGIAATITHGNTLTREVWDVWNTPAYYGMKGQIKNEIRCRR